jgi:predicted ATPase
MIKSIGIENFRCFRKMEAEGLKRINVIVGPNGSGKTALLEAIFLASGASPELAHRLRLFRGMGTTLEISGVEGLEAAWKNLFHNFNQRKSISIELAATDMLSRKLDVTVGGTEELRLPLQTGRATLTAPVRFVWTDANKHVFESRPTIVDDKLTFPQARTPNKIVFVPANFRLAPEEAAKRLSSLSRVNAATDLVETLTDAYPEIEAISVENSDGSWEVFVQLTGLEERIPLALYSAGASRLVAMMLSIASATGGTVLIDEIENGFYYKTLGEVWRVLTTLAEEFKCQLFVSTHSAECLRALAPLVEAQPDVFSLANLEKKGVESRVTVSSGEVMAAAIESGFEVR